MIKRRLQKFNFFFEFFEKNSILPFYEKVNNTTNGQISVNQSTSKIVGSKGGVFVVNFIPPYLDAKINIQSSPYRAFQVKPRTGFIMDLSPFSNADDYLKSHLGTKNRRNILSRLKRLETCFDITYKSYFGEIEKSEYDFLFGEFERMISNRFEQRGDEHVGFQRWDDYKESVYDLIRNKRASLFVIYDQNKPIVINLNYHYQNILDIAIPSYDIDYFKFGLGQTVLVKQLEWCFQNNYVRVDLRWGELAYKRLWCNAIMKYKCDIVYNKNIPTSILLAFFISKGVNVKRALADRKMWPINLKFLFNGKDNENSGKNVDEVAAARFEELESLPSQEELRILDINTEEFRFLRNHVYNFQYIKNEHTGNIRVFSINTEKMSYIIQGKSKLQKLIL